MKKRFSMIPIIILAVIIAAVSPTRGKTEIKADYADAESFEAALNRGENLEGKVVTFVAGEFHPQSKLGYNVFAGEHLNFVSDRNPDIKEGNIVTVRVTEINNLLGSWVIKYEKLSCEEGSLPPVTKEKITETSSSEPVSADFDLTEAPADKKREKLPLELVDYGWCGTPDNYSDSVYVSFCGIVRNPNTEYAAIFPEVIATVKNKEGQILTTESQMGGKIMPEDTVTLIGLFSIRKEDITDGAQILFDVKCSKMTGVIEGESPKTTDFEAVNISERPSGSEDLVTGEIINNYGKDVKSVNISLIFRKNGKIVGMEETFADDIKSDRATPFKINIFGDVPEHDSIEISVQEW